MTNMVGAEVRQALNFVASATQSLETVERALTRAQRELTSGGAVSRSEAAYREEAVRFVLDAVLASIGWRGLDRRRFKALIAAESRRTPNDGPESVKHVVLQDEARKVLGIQA